MPDGLQAAGYVTEYKIDYYIMQANTSPLQAVRKRAPVQRGDSAPVVGAETSSKPRAATKHPTSSTSTFQHSTFIVPLHLISARFNSSKAPKMTSLETAAIPPNIAAQLPSVNFGFDELKERMSKFTLAFDDFIEKRREKALDTRTNFARDVADLNENEKTIKKNIEHYEQEEIKIAANTEKEIQETADLENEISTIRSQKATREAENETLNAQIREQSAAISKKRAKLLEEKQALASHANHNQPELAFWEDYLGLRIEGAGRLDHVRFIFTCLDPADPDREFEVVVSVESRDYEIIGARPKLDEATKARCLDILNETRSIAKFLKAVRQEFRNGIAN
ncbi:hypothetical protein Dda_0478 [Drechslerella dactyloides]|uniref:Kinetochore protein SPC25 n=1 Tax=Drechslerella dactyloides TaxID=74499 RepID=A0AAD6J4J1_DREDA|nr:hypothetical protein Dda_0478 [Drechslerella dactyloides]